jgi:signal transduction histidine kinase
VKHEFDRFLVKQRQSDIDAATRIIRAGGRARLHESIERASRDHGVRVVVFGDAGTIIARYPPELDRYTIVRRENGLDLSSKGGGRLESLMVRGNGLRVAGIGTVYFLPRQPSDARQSFRLSIDRWLLIGLGVAALLGVAVVLTFFRRVFRPVDELTTGARALAGGRLDARVPVRGNDEIAELGAAFNSMAEALERNERARRNMVSDVAHELRTPLTNIRVQIEGAQDGVIAADTKFLASIEEETAILARLVDDLQQLSLADAGQLRLELAEVSVAEIVERALSGLPTHKRIVTRDVDPSLVVCADGRRIVQVVRNLAVNAIAHARSGVHVAAVRGGERVEIRVEDDGPGVPPEHVEHIFDRFYRADASRSRTTGGAGLGLAIAKQLVELHGGTIAYERPAFVVTIRLFITS